MFSVNSDGLLALKARIQTVIDFMPTFCEEAVQLVADEAVLEISVVCPYDGELDNGQIPGEEGHLNMSFYAESQQSGIISEMTVKTLEPIKLSYVTGGTNSPILPLSAKALWWPGLAHPVSSVSGQQANDFVTPVRDAIASEVPDIVQPVIDEIMQALNG
jgi:hypothetical protein